MAIQAIRRKTGLKFRAFLKIRGQKRISKIFSRKTDAKIWIDSLKQELRIHPLGYKPWVEKTLFSDFSAHWMEKYAKVKRSPSTVARNEIILRVYLNPYFGNLDLKEISPMLIDEFVADLKKKTTLKNQTINDMLALFRKILNDAIKWQKLMFNPLNAVSFLTEDPQGFDFWTREEVQKFLLANQNSKFCPLYILALNTGMRQGEIFALRWGEVDFQNRFIKICRTYNSSLKLVRETTKGRKILHVGINDTLLPVLVQHYDRRNRNSDLVFHNDAGGFLDKDNFVGRYFRKDIERAGVRRIRFHDLRHTFASHFVMSGGSLFDLQQILGHAQIKTTLRYAHFTPDHLKSKMNLVNFSDFKSAPKVHTFAEGKE